MTYIDGVLGASVSAWERHPEPPSQAWNNDESASVWLGVEVRHDQPAEVNGSKNVQVEEVAVHIEVGVVPSVKKTNQITYMLPVPRLLSNYCYWGDTSQLFARMNPKN